LLDCKITVDYRDLRLNAAKQGYGVASSLAANLDDAESSVIECAAKIGNLKEDVLNGSLRRKSPLGAYINPEFINLTGSSPVGRLRLIRQGGMIHCLHANTQSNDFRLIHNAAIGSSNTASISMEAKSSDDVGQVDVIVE